MFTTLMALATGATVVTDGEASASVARVGEGGEAEPVDSEVSMPGSDEQDRDLGKADTK